MRYRTKLYISREYFSENVKNIQTVYPNHKILFMIKAGGYGHGIIEMAELAIKNGIKDFGVATSSEAKLLRDHLFDYFFNIYVFSDLDLDFKFHKELYLNNRILPVLSHIDDLKIILNDTEFTYFPLCIKFNTGMNRLGFRKENIGELIDLLNNSGRKTIYHLFSHLATSGKHDDPLTDLQLEEFKQIKQILIKENFTIANSSIANSGAIEQGLVSDDENFIRPGIILYGPSALDNMYRESSKIKNKLISRLESYIIEKIDVKKGARVGYGGLNISADGSLLLVAIGYGDGLTFYNKNISLKIKDHDAVVLGRPNMDMLQLFIPGSIDLKRGDIINLWETNEDVYNIADQMDSISYELFCLLGERIPRIYL